MGMAELYYESTPGRALRSPQSHGANFTRMGNWAIHRGPGLQSVLWRRELGRGGWLGGRIRSEAHWSGANGVNRSLCKCKARLRCSGTFSAKPVRFDID